MNTYTVLLADDEEEVIQVILKKIDWESLGFSVIGYANNGVKALEMVEEFQPDLVMTDIKMPYMDGIELSHRIKEDFPATKLLFFTGFDEFEYAKEAVHLEVEEYILKPVNASELTEILTRLKEKLDEEIREKRSVETLQTYYLESLPVLRENFYTTLIEGQIHEKELPKCLSDCQISFEGPYFCCLVIHTSASQMPEDMNPMLLFTSVRKQAEERLKERWRAKCFTYLGNTVLIAQLEGEQEITWLTDECDRFCRYVRRIIGAVVTVGIGQVCGSVTELPQSYGSAREAVSYRVIYGASRAINMKEIAPQELSVPEPDSGAELKELFKAIRLGTEEEVAEAVKGYIDYLYAPAQTLQMHHIAIMELLSALYRFAANHEVAVDELSGDVRELYGKLLDIEREALQGWLRGIGLSFRDKLFRARSSSTQSLIARAEEYIRDHYSDEAFSLDDISRAMNVSNSYFSATFKKETGHSFIGYLTDYRMERASQLLIETNDKSYRIAQSVGYTDPNYFSYVFKRRFGVAPSKYRTEHGASEN